MKRDTRRTTHLLVYVQPLRNAMNAILVAALNISVYTNAMIFELFHAMCFDASWQYSKRYNIS
jgi:hypothetical protein